MAIKHTDTKHPRNPKALYQKTQAKNQRIKEAKEQRIN
jgi:hypothetical protein